MRTFIFAALAATLLAGSANAQSPSPDSGKPATIPFVRFGNIQDFEADGDKGVWLKDRSRKWYYASMFGPCTNLPFAVRLGVDTRFNGDTLDSMGTLLVDGQRCTIEKLTASDGPPKPVKKAKS